MSIGALHRVQPPEEKEPEKVAEQQAQSVIPVAEPGFWHKFKQALKGQK